MANGTPLIRNYNVFVREHGKKESGAPGFLSLDGSEGNFYTFRSIAWSPDSTHLVVCRVRPGYRRKVHYIESSPADQLQPKHSTRDYAKPGDTLDIASPRFSMCPRKSKPTSIMPCSRTLSALRSQCGARAARHSRSSTTGEVIRFIA